VCLETRWLGQKPWFLEEPKKKSQETAPQKNSCGKNARKIDFSCKYQGKIQKVFLAKMRKNRKKLPPRKKFRANFFCGSPSCDAGGCAS
jgi:hypothetical protein